MAPFCNLFMERPSYYYYYWQQRQRETSLDLLEDVIEPMFAHQLWREVLSTESTELQPQCLQTFYHSSERYRLMTTSALASRETTSCLQAGNGHVSRRRSSGNRRTLAPSYMYTSLPEIYVHPQPIYYISPQMAFSSRCFSAAAPTLWNKHSANIEH